MWVYNLMGYQWNPFHARGGGGGVTFPIFILSGKIQVSNEWLIIENSGREIVLLKMFKKNTGTLYGPIALLAFKEMSE